jgi:hypothetical protein
MKMRCVCSATCIAAMILSNHSSGQEVRDTPRPERVAVFYFGNSFLENSVPWFHPTLAGTAGKQLKVQTAIGPGWQIWMHVDAMRRNPDGHPRKTLASGDWNAVLIQHFGTHPGLKDNVRKSVFLNQEFDEPRDVSDLASAAEIIDLLLASAKNPDQARVFIYSSWPGMPRRGRVEQTSAGGTRKVARVGRAAARRNPQTTQGAQAHARRKWTRWCASSTTPSTGWDATSGTPRCLGRARTPTAATT